VGRTPRSSRKEARIVSWLNSSPADCRTIRFYAPSYRPIQEVCRDANRTEQAPKTRKNTIQVVWTEPCWRCGNVRWWHRIVRGCICGVKKGASLYRRPLRCGHRLCYNCNLVRVVIRLLRTTLYELCISNPQFQIPVIIRSIAVQLIFRIRISEAGKSECHYQELSRKSVSARQAALTASQPAFNRPSSMVLSSEFKGSCRCESRGIRSPSSSQQEQARVRTAVINLDFYYFGGIKLLWIIYKTKS